MRRRTLLAVAVLLGLIALLSRWVGQDGPGRAQPGEVPAAVADAETATRPAGDRKRRRKKAEVAIPVEAPSEEPAVPKLVWRVRAVDPAGKPVHGVTLLPARAGHDERVMTGADGWGAFARREDEGPVRVWLSGVTRRRKVTLSEHESQLVIDDVVPLEVVAIDEETGDIVPPSGGKGAHMNFGDGCVLPLAPSGNRYAAPAAADHGDERFLSVRGTLATPPEYVSSTFSTGGTLSAVASLVRVVTPVRAAARLRIAVTDRVGKPAEGLDWVRVDVDGARRTEKAVFSEDGIVRPLDVPFVRNSLVEVWVGRMYHWVKGSFRFGPVLEDEYILEVQLQQFKMARPRRNMRCGGAHGSFEMDYAHPPEGDGEVTVRFLRRDGRPARRAMVRLLGTTETGSDTIWNWTDDRRTDDQGLVHFTGLPGGSVEALSLEPGLLGGTSAGELAAGGRTVLELRESSGKTTLVTVVDGQGRPLPGAEILVNTKRRDGVPYVKLVGDTQELELVTDRLGRIELTGLPAGEIGVEARWDIRRAKRTVAAGESVRIELPPIER